MSGGMDRRLEAKPQVTQGDTGNIESRHNLDHVKLFQAARGILTAL